MEHTKCTCRSGYVCGYCRLKQSSCTTKTKEYSNSDDCCSDVNKIKLITEDNSKKIDTINDDIDGLITKIDSNKNKLDKDDTEISNIKDNIEHLSEKIQCSPIKEAEPTYNIGDWDNSTITPSPDNIECIPDGVDTSMRLPLKAGDVTKKGDCEFMSLVDDNKTEPNKKTAYNGEWVNLCEVPEVFNCFFDRRIATELEDDPVVEGKNLCERVTALEKKQDDVLISVVKDPDTGVVTFKTLKGDTFTAKDVYTNGFALVNGEYVVTLNTGATFKAPAYTPKPTPYYWSGLVDSEDTTPADGKILDMFTYVAPEKGVYQLSGWMGLYINSDNYTDSGTAMTHGDSEGHLLYRGKDVTIGDSEDGNNITNSDNIYNNGGVMWIGELNAGEAITFRIKERLRRTIPTKISNSYNIGIVKVSI